MVPKKVNAEIKKKKKVFAMHNKLSDNLKIR